jgi:hypothetical protein
MTRDCAEQVAVAIEMLVATMLVADKLKNAASQQAVDDAQQRLIDTLEHV